MMRWFQTSFMVFLLALSSCEEQKKEDYLPGYSGTQGEIIVVAPEVVWNSNDMDYFREYLNILMPGLPAGEKMFQTMEVKTKGFKDIFKTHRNILEIKVDHTNQTQVTIKKEVHARKQTYVTINLQNIRDLGKVAEERMRDILWYFHDSELNRLISRNMEFGPDALDDQIREKTGLSLVMQEDFAIAKEAEDFIWLRLDREKPIGGYQHQISQGIMIYSRPYTDTAMFDSASLATWKNEMNAKYVEGPHGSHMGISYRLYPPEYSNSVFLDQAATEVRGLWRMQGAKGVFMGGPFYGLAFYNPTNERQYMVEGYVYGPQFNKIAFMREVEAIIKSIKLSQGS